MVRVLVNNAIRCPVVSLADMDESLWDEVIAVNLKGTYLTCKAFLPGMTANAQGVIINMVSTDAMPGLSAYIASKQGILGLSLSLALETGVNGVKVIPFGPGMVDTPGIRGAQAEGLAPRLGMAKEQFLNISLHTAYEGFMPVEHAGAATVYLATRLAEEYHGQMVTGYEVLERAGVIKPTLVVNEAFTARSERPDEHNETLDEQMAQTSSLIEDLHKILVETDNEFNKLPMFIRPMARSGFKQKAGGSLEDWLRRIKGLADNVAAIQQANPPKITAEVITDLSGQFGKLTNYFLGVPAETARFTKDAEFLAQITNTSNQRIAVIEHLLENLRIFSTN